MRRRGIAVWLVTAALVAGAAVPALALWTDTDPVENNAFSTATLQPPSGLAASAGCTLLLPKVDLTWTATTSAKADGYEILRSTTSGGPYSVIATLVGKTTTSYSDTDVVLGTTYHYVARTVYESWTSTDSNEASATTPVVC